MPIAVMTNGHNHWHDVFGCRHLIHKSTWKYNTVNLLRLDENADLNLNYNQFMEHSMKLKQECFKKKKFVLIRKTIKLTHG